MPVIFLLIFKDFTLADFNTVISRARQKTIDKIQQVERIQKTNPKLKPMKKVHLDYFKPMEPYELRIRDIVKDRIKNFYMVTLKNKFLLEKQKNMSLL